MRILIKLCSFVIEQIIFVVFSNNKRRKNTGVEPVKHQYS